MRAENRAQGAHVRNDELNERLRASVETLLDCFGMFTAIRAPEGTIVDFRIDHLNQAACKTSGRSLDEQVGRGMLEMWPALRGSAIFEAYCAIVEEGIPFSREMEVYAAGAEDGQHPQWWDVKAVKSGDGFVAAWRDVTEHRRETEAEAERARRESHERLRIAQRAARLGIHDYDIETGRIRWDDRVREFWGVAADEPVNYQTFLEGLHPDDRAATEARLRESLEPGRDGLFFAVYRVINRIDRTQRWIEATGQVFFDHERAVRLVGTVIDISDRRHAEQALEASERRYRRLVESLRDAFVVVNMAGHILDSNAAYRDMLGYTEAELRRMTYVDLTPTRWHAMEAKIVAEQVLPTGASNIYEKEYRRKDGTVFPAELRTYLIRDDAGRPEQMWATVRDISDRKKAEAALRESEERWRTLADNISQFAWMADDKGHVYWHNRRWYDYTGATPEEMQGWGWTTVLHSDHVERVVARIQHAWDTGDPWEDTFPLRGKGGGYRWFLSRAVPIRNGEGRIVRWFGTNTDITEQRAAEEALRAADRRKDHFLATLAHELRNPLAPIRQASAVGLSGTATPAQVRWSLEIIERQAKHMALLLDDLLDISRVTRGRLELQRIMLTADAVVQAAVETARPYIEERRHVLETALPEAPIALYGDPVRLAQVLSNLLTNAAKFTPPGGRISVQAHCTDGWVELVVADNGIGIPASELERVFEMFEQGAAPPHLAPEGLGIGLALSRALVELHGGTLKATSAGVGKGAQFVLRLPLPQETAAHPDMPSPLPAECAAARRILVVDDNLDAAETLARLMRIHGHEVHTVHDGETAVAAAETLRPEVVLLDLGLPGADGYEVARRLRATRDRNHFVLVAVTGWGQPEDRRRTEEAGFDHHLVKPLDVQALTLILAEAPGMPSQRQASGA